MNRFIRILIYSWISLLCFLGGLIGFTYYSLPDVTLLLNKNPPTTAFIEYRRQEAKTAGKILTIHQHWISLSKIPQLLRRVIIVSEDAAFWSHTGVDWEELKKSIRKTVEEGEKLRGASTITQQTAKNLYLSPKRSFYRKFKEFWIATDLEKHLSKNRILELYVNIIELGKGIFGVSSASQYYFGKRPSQLSLFEIIRLAAIIPKPLGINPTKPSNALKWRSKEILKRVYYYKWITEEEFLQTFIQFDKFFQK